MSEKFKNQDILDRMEELCPQSLYPTGMEEAIIGIIDQFRDGGRYMMPCISYDKMIKILIDRDKMTHEEAIEYADFNIVGAYMGENQAVYLYDE
jgi:hypothetical protein